MSYRRAAFAVSLLPNYCEPHGEAEPKRNIPPVFQDDFSSNILQRGYGKPPRWNVARLVPAVRFKLNWPQRDRDAEQNELRKIETAGIVFAQNVSASLCLCG